MKYFENGRFFWIICALKSLTNFNQCLHLKDIFFGKWKQRISAQNRSASEWALVGATKSTMKVKQASGGALDTMMLLNKTWDQIWCISTHDIKRPQCSPSETIGHPNYDGSFLSQTLLHTNDKSNASGILHLLWTSLGHILTP